MRHENRTSRDEDVEEQQIATLIQRAGRRPQPSADARETVRAAVHAQWRAVVAARAARRRRALSSAIAAGLAVAGIAVWLSVPSLRGQQQPPVATVARISGAVEVSASNAVTAWQPLVEGSRLRLGSELRTQRGGRAALHLPGDLSVRLDENSLVALLARDRISLRRGTVYVDAGEHPDQAAPLEVETVYGTVRHLGTQYEVRLADNGVRLRVREGRIALAGDGGVHEGRAGEELIISQGGALQRARIGPADAGWAWASDIAPAFDIENQPLAEFLRWVGRETGRQIVYANARTEEEARAILLRGSVQGFAPDRALEAVLATTDLAWRELPDQLVIDFKSDDRSGE